MSLPDLDLTILKTLITNKKHALDFSNECDAKLFSTEVWNVANIIIGYIKTYKDVPTLRVITERLEKGNNTKLIEHIKSVWSQIDKISVNDSEYKHDLSKLKRRFAEREITSMKEKLLNIDSGTMDIDRAVLDMQKTVQSIKSLNQIKAYENKTVKEYLNIFANKYNSKKENPNFDKGVLTKYSFLDFATNGLKPADFLLIAGESGFGKSLFLQNIAIQTWMQNNTIEQTSDFTGGKDIIYFSLEMPYEDCFNRFISRLSGIPSRKIENATLEKDEFVKIKQCLSFINNYPYNFHIVDIANACANDLDLILDNSGENFNAIFIDYLGIMETNEKSNEADWLKQGIIAYEVRSIGRKYSKPVLSAVQLNRKSTGKDKSSADNIGLSRLARSGTIATHATHVVQIENRPSEENYPDFLYHIIKNRKGPKGKGSLYKNLACATLIDKPVDKDSDDINNQFIDRDDISKDIDKLEI